MIHSPGSYELREVEKTNAKFCNMTGLTLLRPALWHGKPDKILPAKRHILIRLPTYAPHTIDRAVQPACITALITAQLRLFRSSSSSRHNRAFKWRHVWDPTYLLTQWTYLQPNHRQLCRSSHYRVRNNTLLCHRFCSCITSSTGTVVESW